MSPAEQKRHRLQISLTLDEDTHLGSGASGPGVNALIAIDRLGRPVIWASHLEGLLREQESLQGSTPLNRSLFGTRAGERQEAVFTSLYCDKKPDYRVWRTTARKSFDNRAPDENTLRAVQMIPRGTRFQGEVEVPTHQREELSKFLRQLTAIGKGRANGAGKVTITVGELFPDARPLQLGSATTRVRLLLRARDPVCVASTAVPGNLIPTASYIPGRTLLGALANWLHQRGCDDTATCFTSGQILVSDALPLPDGEPTHDEIAIDLSTLDALPAPLALKGKKAGRIDGTVPWWALHEAEAERYFATDHQEKGSNDERSPGPANVKRLPGDLYLYRSGGASWKAFRPTMRTRLRSGYPNPGQRDPSLFAIQHLAEQTYFLAELQGEPATLQHVCEALRPVLEGTAWLRIGRAGAPVEIAKAAAHAPSPMPVFEKEGLLTLTSDLLVRDEMLRWRTRLTAKDFAEIAGWPEEEIHVTMASQDSALVRSFNGTSRLWRLPIAGIRRGSVFRIKGPGVAALARAASEGRWLGEHCHEGFGRFRLDAKDDLPGRLELKTKRETNPSDAQPYAGDKDTREDSLCAEARRWCDGHQRLAAVRTDTHRPPSLAQWMDLVTELERSTTADNDAIRRRLDPQTLGGRSWSDPHAKAVLELIEKTPNETRAISARLFVRWLRLAMPQQPTAGDAQEQP